MKLFQKTDLLYEQFSRAISTASINRALQEIVKKHPPSRIGRTRLKFFYATQTRTKPPPFVLFANNPDHIHFSYKRFLINQLRSYLRLELTPIRLKFRKK